jgi:hypothetical protein
MQIFIPDFRGRGGGSWDSKGGVPDFILKNEEIAAHEQSIFYVEKNTKSFG